jgi:transaldolase
MGQRRIKIFGDGADAKHILELYRARSVDGFTTNPTLMHKAGVANYEQFAQDVLAIVRDVPISFEVFSDDFSEMRRQALKIAGWGPNVYVKIPVMNANRESAAGLIRSLTEDGVKVNVTAVLTTEQVREMMEVLWPGTPTIISVFAGRIADTGRDPVPIICESKRIVRDFSSDAELLWASCREVLNVVQAEQAGCDIITVTHDLLRKIPSFGKPLLDVSLETVRMFSNDAKAAGYAL